jgi:hypothetical protein
MDHTNASGAKTTMKIRTDKILTKCADHALKTACFGRNGAHTTHDLVLAETLATSMATSEAGAAPRNSLIAFGHRAGDLSAATATSVVGLDNVRGSE